MSTRTQLMSDEDVEASNGGKPVTLDTLPELVEEKLLELGKLCHKAGVTLVVAGGMCAYTEDGGYVGIPISKLAVDLAHPQASAMLGLALQSTAEALGALAKGRHEVEKDARAAAQAN